MCIDRATLGTTFLGKNVKVGNMAHISHNVTIDENSLIIGPLVICGSCVIGKNVWIGPGSTVRQKLHVGNNAVIGIGSTVVKHVPEGETVAGNPATRFKK